MRAKVCMRGEWETNTKTRKTSLRSSSDLVLLMFCVGDQGQWKENGFSPKFDSPR